MPKSPNRSSNRWSSLQGRSKSCCQPSSSSAVASSGTFISTSPRKVSFEDASHSDSEASTSSQQHEEHPPQSPSCTRTSTLRGKRSLLVRPTTSLSLVDLANQMDDDAGEEQQPHRHREEDHSYDVDCYRTERTAKRICSPQASPHSSIAFPASHRQLASPWGHFVETVPVEEEGLILASPAPTATSTPRPYFFGTAEVDCSRTNSASSSHHDHSCHCCTSCRIRRASPYGDYKNRDTRRRNHTEAREAACVPSPQSLSFLQLQESFKIQSSSSSASRDAAPKFRLSPRKQIRWGDSSNIHAVGGDDSCEFTGPLIGAFSGLQVQHEEESASRRLYDGTIN